MEATEQQIYLLRVALGDELFELMARSLGADPRVQDAHTIDIVVRKDAVEKRIEGDWVKHLARIVLPPR
jgi:hypothetical protein